MSAKKMKENKPEELREEQVPDMLETAGAAPRAEATAPEAPETGTAAPAETAAPAAEGEGEVLKQQLADTSDKLLRTLAEYDNYRKRSQRERAEVYPEAVAATVTKLLPVVDNFERALQAECADAEFKKGVEMIFISFQETMKAMGVEEIEAQGKEFDPNLHNAVMHVDNDTLGDNVVALVMQKGYKIGERVLRHAMVQVAN